MQRALGRCGFILLCACPVFAALNVRDFGARGDGVAKDTALQKTIDAAEQQGGGAGLMPAGKYLSGTIHLKSNVRRLREVGSQ